VTRLLLAVVLAAMPAAPAFAQNGAASDAQERAAADPWWQRYAAWLERLHDQGVYPSAGVVVAGSGLAFGAGLRDTHFGGGPIGGEIDAMWSIRGYGAYRVRIGWIDRLRDTERLRPADAKVSSPFEDFGETRPGAALYLEAVYRDYPRMSFYGTGPAAPIQTRTDFGLSGLSADIVAHWQPRAGLGVSGRVGVLDFDVGRGTNDATTDVVDLHDQATAAGLFARPRFVTTGAGLVFDRRDAPGAASRGGVAALSLWHFAPLGAPGPTITRLSWDGRLYRGVSRLPAVVALRLGLAHDWTATGAPTPFYLQQTLGGSDTLRGFRGYRFRDQALAHGSIEYRHMVRSFLEIAPFLDAGVVARGVSDLAWSAVRVSPGIGVRVHVERQVVFRLDWARSAEGHRFALALSHPF
jgi:hypothetical protein